MNIDSFNKELAEAGFPPQVREYIAKSFYDGLAEVILENVKKSYCFVNECRRVVG